MPTYVWPGGIGQATGDDLVVNAPLTLTGQVWFVSSETGSDANNGRSAEGAKATLASAYTAASNNDWIVLASDHDETVTATQTVAKSITIVGCGQSAGKPTAKLRNNQAGNVLLYISADGVHLRNIYFPENVQSCAGQRVLWSGSPNLGCSTVGCYFECGNFDTVEAMTVGGAANANRFRIERCTWVSTATAYATRPGQGLRLLDVVDTSVVDCIFDGGTHGFSGTGPSIDGVAFSVSNGAGTSERVYIENLTLLRGADAYILSTVTGYMVGVTTTGSARVTW